MPCPNMLSQAPAIIIPSIRTFSLPLSSCECQSDFQSLWSATKLGGLELTSSKNKRTSASCACGLSSLDSGPRFKQCQQPVVIGPWDNTRKDKEEACVKH